MVITSLKAEVVTNHSEITEAQSPGGRPFVRLHTARGTIDIALEQLEIVGAEAARARRAFEDKIDRMADGKLS